MQPSVVEMQHSNNITYCAPINVSEIDAFRE